MNNIQKLTLTLSAFTVLSTSIALANSNDMAKGVKVNGAVDICSLPREVEEGSISIQKGKKRNYFKLAKIKASEAASIANLAFPGETIELELEKENKTLVWEVTQHGLNGEEVELMIDAGNGNLLAAEIEDDDHGLKSWFGRGDDKKKLCDVEQS